MRHNRLDTSRRFFYCNQHQAYKSSRPALFANNLNMLYLPEKTKGGTMRDIKPLLTGSSFHWAGQYLGLSYL